MNATTLRDSIREVGRAIRRPERLARRWRDRATERTDAPPAAVFAVLLVNAIFGTAIYGMFMHIHRGLSGMGEGALLLPVGAGIAWTIAFPSLYVVNRILGSKLDFTTTALAAAITVSFGATAMVAMAPMTWFFSMAIPVDPARWGVNLVVFAAVGVCMADVFMRVMKAVEPSRFRIYPALWLMLLTALGGQIFALLGLFQF